jgi:hypothetical protein
MIDLEAIKIDIKTGEESFSFSNSNLDFKLIDFWSWSQSDLLNNSLRGVLAEFIVKTALDINNNYRLEWDAFDLITDGDIKIEVKSSAYLQSWKQKGLSKISFDIAPKRGWTAETNEYSASATRGADYYVF